MAGLNIPGVTDQYNTNETVEKLMKVERIPLTREQQQLEEYKQQKDAWREINTQLTSLRDSTKTLYSFENPFNNKLTTSSQESAITAEANRSAEFQSFKVDVIQPATTDRFLSDELPTEFTVPAGMYTYKVGEKQININWKGGSLKNFSDAINKRSNGIIKSMIIGSSAGKKTLLIESLQTGKENKLVFEGEAKNFAEASGMISTIKSTSTTFGTNKLELSNPTNLPKSSETRMPQLSLNNTILEDGKITVSPRGAFQLPVPPSVKNNPNLKLSFTVKQINTTDITEELNKIPVEPIIPEGGFAEFAGISITNIKSETQLPAQTTPPAPLSPIKESNVLFALMEDGTEREITLPSDLSSEQKVEISLSDFIGIKAISVKNTNTGSAYEISEFSAYNPNSNLGFKPNHPVSEADDAIIKYEGITITRSSNKIDDVVPEVTLNIHDKTEKTATIDIKPDAEASKDALIEFVGKYNQAVAKINILSQNKNDIIEELNYLSDEEKDKSREQLGLFATDFSLTSIKTNMANIVSTKYAFSDEATVTMLAQIGISTNASGFSSSYSQSRLRGYLEIDEKKLDSALNDHLDEIKALFGYDSDGDLIIDSGIAYLLDKQLSAYTQTGGILAMKTSSLDSKIKTSESKISKLESQMDSKEAELRQKYSSMTGSLNSLENQQNTISNFSKQQNNNR